MFTHFLHTLQHYAIEIAPSLALGLLLSGIIHEFVPQSLVNRYLSRKGILPILYVTITGIILPLCCFGTLPVAIGFRKKGVPLGPVLAFLIATPATSLTAIFVTWRLLGIGFTLYLCLSVIILGLIIGVIGNSLPFKEIESQSAACPMCAEENEFIDPICGMTVDPETSIRYEYNNKMYYFCSANCKSKFIAEPQKYARKDRHINHQHHQNGIKNRILSVLTFGFIDILKEIGLELVIGLILAALVASITPLGNIIKNYLVAGYGYLFALIFGLMMYICSTASVPLVHAFISQGLNIGAGFVLLLVGPITSYGTILVIRKEFGTKILLFYLGVISSLSLILGYLYSLLAK